MAKPQKRNDFHLVKNSQDEIITQQKAEGSKPKQYRLKKKIGPGLSVGTIVEQDIVDYWLANFIGAETWFEEV